MKYFSTLFLFFASLFSLYSCTSNNKDTVGNTINNEQAIKIKRFDRDLYSFLLSPDSLKKQSLKKDYGDFLNAFGAVTINNPDANSITYYPSLETYFANPMLSQIYKDAIDTFKNVDLYENELTEANSLIKKNFKNETLPTLCMHISGFKANTISMKDLISISTDKYLGTDYPLYQQFFEEYQRQEMKPEMIVRDYLKAWVFGKIPVTNDRKNLLSEMINSGKVLYTLNILLPNWSEADLMGYTMQQLDWAKNNEKQIWKTTLSNNYLFSTEYQVILKYIEDAPHTILISQDSPGKLGIWLGWQIVKAYALKTNAGIEAILKEIDIQKILKDSKYNP